MLSEFENYLKSKTSLTDDEIHIISSSALRQNLNRNELVLKAGSVCRHKVFVVKGMLRTFSTSTNGNEYILQFSPELTWTLDVESYDKEIPSQVNIEAIEPTEVLLWTKKDFTRFLNEIPEFKKLSQQIISYNIYYNRQRMLTALSATPEEKYEDFTKRFPSLLLRLPLRMIASYLGISIKTLTRIRHSQLHR